MNTRTVTTWYTGYDGVEYAAETEVAACREYSDSCDCSDCEQERRDIEDNFRMVSSHFDRC